MGYTYGIMIRDMDTKTSGFLQCMHAILLADSCYDLGYLNNCYELLRKELCGMR